MEAKSVEALPNGRAWWYEPKWDGFRCLVFRDGDRVQLMSKAGKPLTRYFPDLVVTVRSLTTSRFVLDGEIVVPVDGVLSFDQLLQRIHPAASRVRMLAAHAPALLIVFDLLAVGNTALIDRPLAERRHRLETFLHRHGSHVGSVRLSPATDALARARGWLTSGRLGLDGVVAKRRDLPYQGGERSGMEKVKCIRTADCVVGGFRYASRGQAVGSLLLGLYTKARLLDHVGFTSAFSAAERADVTRRVVPLAGGEGFTGRKPGWTESMEH